MFIIGYRRDRSKRVFDRFAGSLNKSLPPATTSLNPDMSSHYKAFLVVITLAVIVFWLARPIFTKFMADEDYLRRRNLWLCLTTSAFLIPNFWVHMGIAAVLVYRAVKKDSNPAALYFFLLLAIPPLEESIPGFGLVNYIFPINHIRLLCILIMLPLAIKIVKRGLEAGGSTTKRTWLPSDIFLVAYGCLQVFLYAPYSSVTDTSRSLLMMILDMLIPYFVISRFCTTKGRIVEAAAAFALAAFVLAPVAIFEVFKGWLVYDQLAAYWNVDLNIGGYLLRGDSVRAVVTSGNSIVLGNFFAVGLGIWLYLVSKTQLKHAWLGSIVIVGGLIAAFSRGPWVGAAVSIFVFFAAGPNPSSRLFKLSALTVVLACALLVTPYGNKVIDYLPFVGTVDAGNVSYRQAINDRALLIIGLNPFFGSPFFSQYMEDLRTGLGIIDFLNVYLSIGMAYGLITLSAFILFFASSIYRCMSQVRQYLKTDHDSALLGASLVCGLVATLIIIYTASNYLSIPYIYVGLTALLIAFSRMQINESKDLYASLHVPMKNRNMLKPSGA
jgi:O-Antigen ligase